MKYYIYCRKSSEEDTKQIQSLETQERLLIEYAQNHNLQIAKIIKEARSARVDGNRPLFSQILRDIKARKIDGILVAHLDRLSRNGIESGMIAKYLESGLLKEIRTPSEVFNSIHDILAMDINFMFASYYSRNLSIRVREGLDTKFQKGEYSGPAPLGYTNMNGKIVMDPISAPIIQQLFQLYSIGSYSLKDIALIAYDMGLRTRIAKSKVSKSVIHRCLTDPTYYGAVRRKGEIRVGIHEPIISKVMFDQVQDILTGKHLTKKQKHSFLYRGYLSCAVCGCALTATIKKERYIYYYCTNGKSICNEHRYYLTEDRVRHGLQGILDDFIVEGCLGELAFEAYAEGMKNKKVLESRITDSQSQRLSVIETRLQKLLDLLLDSKITQEVYDAKYNALTSEKMGLELQLKQRKSTDVESTLELMSKVKKEAFEAAKMFRDGDDEVREYLLKAILWNSEFKGGEIQSVKYKLPFAYLAKVGKSANFEDWRRVWDNYRTYSVYPV